MGANTKTTEHLKKLLADSYVLALKTQNYHWNVTGPNFSSLHVLFEQQYTELAAAIDTLAERIRALGHKAPGSFAEFGKLTSLKEAEDKLNASGMIKDLHSDQLALAKKLKKAIAVAEEENDATTADLLTGRLAVHEKNAWMLDASL